MLQIPGLAGRLRPSDSMWNQRHGTGAEVEDYVWFLLKGPDLASLEGHLLVCETCRVRVSVEGSVREMFLLGLALQSVGDGGIGVPVDMSGRSRVIMINEGAHRGRIALRILHLRTHLPLYSLEVAAGRPDEFATPAWPTLIVTTGPPE
jgi:hypothetical protein